MNVQGKTQCEKKNNINVHGAGNKMHTLLRGGHIVTNVASMTENVQGRKVREKIIKHANEKNITNVWNLEYVLFAKKEKPQTDTRIVLLVEVKRRKYN